MTETSATVLPWFKRILLATDFSEFSAVAVPFAKLLAERYSAKIVVANVVAAEPGTTREVGADARVLAAGEMENFISQAKFAGTLQDSLLLEGPVGEVMAGVVQEKNIDLVVAGTHGRSGVGKLMLGSVAERIFASASCPVVTVSPRARNSWRPGGRLGRVVYATDFASGSLQALPYALSLAKATEASMLLVHAMQPEASPHTDDVTRGYHEHLNALIPMEARNWCRWDTLVIPGDPADVVLKVASDYEADVIVMGAHRIEGPLYRMQVPLSTAYRVVAHSLCPVLRVRHD